MNLTVAINANLDPTVAGGNQTSLRGLIGGLLAEKADIGFCLFAAEALVGTWKGIVGPRMEVVAWPYPLNWFVPEAERSRGLSAAARDWSVLSRESRRAKADTALAKMGADLVHFPYQVFFETSLPYIYEPWDLQHEHLPELFSEEELAWRRDHYRRACCGASLIVTGTAWVRDDLVARYGLDPGKIAVVYRDSCNVRARLNEGERRRALESFNLPEGFAFYPAMNFPHKNHVRALHAITTLRDRHGVTLPLVCSGRILPECFAAIENAVRDLGLGDQVVFLGPVTETQLSALYGSARLLFFPSLFEGLGYPVLEAFHHDLPVVASSASCLPEVVRDAGLMFDPSEPESMVAALRRFLESPRLRQELIEAGRRRLRDFDWRVAVETLRACYKSAAGRTLSPEEESRLARATSQGTLEVG